MVDERISGYAEGIFALANAEGQLERVESELAAIARAVEQSSDLRSTLTEPQLPLDKKHEIIDDLIGSRASALTVGLVQFLVGQGRVPELPAIATSLVETAAASRDKAVAEVRSAVPLDEATVEKLAAALGKATGKSLEVKVVVDPSVIGGLVARVGDMVIDGSLARRFDSVRQAIKG